jgi:hypothetical protein
LYGFADPGDFQRAHREMIEQALHDGMTLRDDRWSEAIAVGSLTFVERVKSELGSRAIHRAVERIDGRSVLQEEREAYDGDLSIKSTPLMLKNTISWDENAETA